MSPPAEHVAPQEPDRIPTARLAALGAGGIIVALLAIAVAGWMADGQDREPRTPPAPAGTVERTLILHTERGLADKSTRLADLDRYGWVDRDAGIARIPIERAIDLVVDGGGGP